jgi:TusA-related sulfurtransferase
MKCPQPIVETARAVNAAAGGDTVVVEATDEGFYKDLEAWCKKTGNELVSLENRLGIYRVVIKKTKQ